MRFKLILAFIEESKTDIVLDAARGAWCGRDECHRYQKCQRAGAKPKTYLLWLDEC